MQVADELKKLAELVDAGLLTQEDYDAQKVKLLTGGGTAPSPQPNIGGHPMGGGHMGQTGIPPKPKKAVSSIGALGAFILGGMSLLPFLLPLGREGYVLGILGAVGWILVGAGGLATKHSLGVAAGVVSFLVGAATLMWFISVFGAEFFMAEELSYAMGYGIPLAMLLFGAWTLSDGNVEGLGKAAGAVLIVAAGISVFVAAGISVLITGEGEMGLAAALAATVGWILLGVTFLKHR